MRKGKFNSILCKCVIICALALTTAACSDSEPKGMTAAEEYDIAFVTRFGIPDRDHTWSMAQDKSVVVLTPNGANEVKVYGMQENEYRLLAHYSNVGSMAQIKFVAPTDMRTVMVSADGCLCEAEVGGMVSIAKAASRTDADPNVEYKDGKYYVLPTAHHKNYTNAVLYEIFKKNNNPQSDNAYYAPDDRRYRHYTESVNRHFDISYASATSTWAGTTYTFYYTTSAPDITTTSDYDGYYSSYAAGDEYTYEGKAYTLQDDKDGNGPYFVKIDDTPYTWILAAEDLGAKDDWDFNDVVLGVTCVQTGASEYEVTVKGLAAGGTLPVKIYYGDNALKPKDSDRDTEFHSWFGESATAYKSSDMINTGIGKETTTLSTVTFTTETSPLTGSWESNAVNGGVLGGFRIEVEGNAGTMTGADKNSNSVAPQMICVDGSWQWPTERVAIDEAYPSDEAENKEGFIDWVKNAVTTAWIQNAKEGKVFKAKK